MARREIRTQSEAVVCDVCGRTLLRGEHAETFLAGGQRREVCDLCTARAANQGWIREAGADELASGRGSASDGGRPLWSRLRGLRERREREVAEADGHAVEAEPPTFAEPDYEPREVHAVPTSGQMKVARALELFNASDHPRTIAGVARSLGAPAVTVRPLPERPSVVSLVVAWELSWYRYELDLADEAGGVRLAEQGYELGELPDEDREPNVAATDDGALVPAA